jgi:hypothetical protein
MLNLKERHNNLNQQLDNTKLSLDLLNNKQDHMSSKQGQFQMSFKLYDLPSLMQENGFLITKTKLCF